MNKVFYKGDVVKWCGVKGVVVAHTNSGLEMDVQFFVENSSCPIHTVRFRADGKKELWHKEPSLELLERKEERHVATFVPCFVKSSRKIEWRLANNSHDRIHNVKFNEDGTITGEIF